MNVSRYTPEETARMGDAIYEQEIRAEIEGSHRGKVVAIDIETHGYEIADTALEASLALKARRSATEIWCIRVGERALYRIGAGSKDSVRS